MPNRPTSRVIRRKDTGDAVTIGLVLAAVVATFVLFGPVLLKSDQKSMDVVATQPTIHQSKRHRMTTAARVRVTLNPRQIVHIDSTDNKSINLQCGDRAETLGLVDNGELVAFDPNSPMKASASGF